MHFHISNPKRISLALGVAQLFVNCRAQPGTGSCPATHLSNIIFSSIHQSSSHYTKTNRILLGSMNYCLMINSQIPAFRFIRIQMLNLHLFLFFHQFHKGSEHYFD